MTVEKILEPDAQIELLTAWAVEGKSWPAVAGEVNLPSSNQARLQARKAVGRLLWLVSTLTESLEVLDLRICTDGSLQCLASKAGGEHCGHLLVGHSGQLCHPEHCHGRQE